MQMLTTICHPPAMYPSQYTPKYRIIERDGKFYKQRYSTHLHRWCSGLKGVDGVFSVASFGSKEEAHTANVIF